MKVRRKSSSREDAEVTSGSRVEDPDEGVLSEVDGILGAKSAGPPPLPYDPQLEEELERNEIEAEIMRQHVRRLEICRDDIDEFCIYVGRDAETNEPIVQEVFHEEFQTLAAEFNRLILMSFPESGKTTQLAILRVLWMLGRNPNIRIVILSKIKDKAVQIVRAIKSYIEKSKELAEVFPELIPGDTWAEDNLIIRRSVHSRDPSIQALGINDSVTGSRIDLLVMDDIIDASNTLTAESRQKVMKRIRGTYIDRVSKTGRIIFLTNAWHPDDLAHALEKEGWYCARYSSTDEDGEPTWPSKWDVARLEQAAIDMGPLEYARAHKCRPRDEGESPFDEASVELAMKLARDNDLELVRDVDPQTLPAGAICITGVDLAITAAAASGSKKSHETALVTVLLWPHDLSRQILWVEAGRWSSKEIRDRVLDHDRRYGSTFVVENNAAQAWIFDIIKNQLDIPEEDRRLPTLVPFTTGANKAHAQFGVEGLAVEMAAGDWIIPTEGLDVAVKEVKKLLTEIRFYTRGSHTGDRLMAMWFAREFARRGRKASKSEKEKAKNLTPDFGGGVSVIEVGGDRKPDVGLSL